MRMLSILGRGLCGLARYAPFGLLLIFALAAVILQYQFYGEWLMRYPLLFLILAFLLLVTYNRFGQDFGLSHLFWHEKPWIQGRMGFYVSLLLALQWGISYEIVRDFDGNERFKDMAIFRDHAWAIPQSLIALRSAGSERDMDDAVGIEHNLDRLKAAGLEPVVNPHGAFRQWPIDTNEARVKAHAPQPAGEPARQSTELTESSSAMESRWMIARRYSLFCAFTYLPSLAMLAMAIFPPLVPRWSDLDVEDRERQLLRIRGAGNGIPFALGMVTAAALVFALIIPCSLGYSWCFGFSLFQQVAQFFHSASFPVAGWGRLPWYPLAAVLTAVALYLNQ